MKIEYYYIIAILLVATIAIRYFIIGIIFRTIKKNSSIYKYLFPFSTSKFLGTIPRSKTQITEGDKYVIIYNRLTYFLYSLIILQGLMLISEQF